VKILRLKVGLLLSQFEDDIMEVGVKLVIQYLGKAFIFVAIVFVLVHSFVIIS